MCSVDSADVQALDGALVDPVAAGTRPPAKAMAATIPRMLGTPTRWPCRKRCTRFGPAIPIDARLRRSTKRTHSSTMASSGTKPMVKSASNPTRSTGKPWASRTTRRSSIGAAGNSLAIRNSRPSTGANTPHGSQPFAASAKKMSCDFIGLNPVGGGSEPPVRAATAAC